MPIIVSLDEEVPNVVIGAFVGNWTWDEYQRTMSQGLEFAESLTGRVDQVIDLSKTLSVPKGIPHIHIKRGREIPIPTADGITLQIGTPNHVRLLYRILTSNQLDESVLNVMPDMAAARQYILKHRANSLG